MSLYIFDRFITRTDSGKTVPYAQVGVVIVGGGPAMLYDNADGSGTPLANPFTADSGGRVQFWLAGGEYTVTATTDDFTIVYPDVIVGTGLFGSVAAVDNQADLASTFVSEGELVSLKGLDDIDDGMGGQFILLDGDDVKDGYAIPSLQEGKYFGRVNYKYAAIKIAYVPPPTPSKKKAIQDEMQNAYDGLILGGGYYGAGALASDWVYETAKNPLGGTNGTFDVRARFGLNISSGGIKTGGSITFNVQLGDNVAGVSCVAYSFADANLPTGGRSARATLTHSGGGLYTGSVTPNTGWSDFLAVEVFMDPVNSANDATLHQETWVVKRVWFVQALSTFFDTNTARVSDGAYLSQIAARVHTTTFWPEQISYDSKTYLINHSRYMTGAQVATCWIAKSGGASTGYGLISSPVTPKRASQLSALGVASRFIFKDAGINIFDGVKTGNIFPVTDASIVLLAPNGDVELRVGHHIDMGSLTWVSGGMDVPYTYTNNYAASDIAAGTSTPNLIMSGEIPMTEVLTLGDVSITPHSFYWDLANSKFVVNVPDIIANPIQLIVPECDCIISATNAHQVKSIGVYADSAVASFVKQLDGSPWCEFYGAGIYGGTVTNSIFRLEGGHGFGVDCFAYGAGNDGFNYHKNGAFRLFNGRANNCLGDGVSPHEDCTLELIYGDYSNNVRAGVIPAYGANCIAFKVTANDNALGLNQYGQFMALSDNSVNSYDGSSQESTRLLLIGGESSSGDYGVVSRGFKSVIEDIGSNIDGHAITSYGCYDSVPSTGLGLIKTDCVDYTGVDFAEYESVQFFK